ncbi:MAG: hypothetical protein EOO90_22335 [Pedobacter sp.]|nr:MAG: hypothetical protein EOO90_22335 [Pedobacter sp.]
MKKHQKAPGNEIYAPASSSQSADEPNSAHSTPVVEHYVKKRKQKADRQVEEEHKNEFRWTSLRYVIL